LPTTLTSAPFLIIMRATRTVPYLAEMCSAVKPFCQHIHPPPTATPTISISNKSSPKSLGKSASLSHNYATKSYWLQWDAPNSTPKWSFSFDDHHPHLIHPSLGRLHSPSQTASRSNQPFCHNTLSRQTDRQTDQPTHTHTHRD